MNFPWSGARNGAVSMRARAKANGVKLGKVSVDTEFEIACG